MKLILPALLAVAGLAAATPAPAAQNSCFRMSDIRNHTVADAHTLYLSVGSKDVQKVTMAGACLAASSGSDPLITESTGGSGLVCRPLDLNLKIDTAGGISPCIIKSIEKLSPEQIAAIPKKLRP